MDDKNNLTSGATEAMTPALRDHAHDSGARNCRMSARIARTIGSVTTTSAS